VAGGIKSFLPVGAGLQCRRTILARNLPFEQRCLRRNVRPAPTSILRLTCLGFCDPVLCVGFHGKNYLMLIKPTGEDMTGDEDTFLAGWHGQYSIVHIAKDALNVLGN